MIAVDLQPRLRNFRPVEVNSPKSVSELDHLGTDRAHSYPTLVQAPERSKRCRPGGGCFGFWPSLDFAAPLVATIDSTLSPVLPDPGLVALAACARLFGLGPG
jgi:hypothetical protein